MAIIFAMISFVLISGLALAVDGSRMLSLRSNLQDIADNAALAAAKSTMDNDQAPKLSAKSIIEEMSINLREDIALNEPKITLDVPNGEAHVELTAELNLFLASVFGKEKQNIVAKSVAAFGQRRIEPISFVLVLDISGSMHANMNGEPRLKILQDTVNDFFSDIQASSNSSDLSSTIRTGLRAFNMQVQLSQSTSMAGGWTHILDKVDNFSTGNGTLPHEAMEQAVAMMKSDRLNSGHTSQREVIIYMTDGEVDNHLITSGKSSTQRTQEACDEAKASGIEIFAVGLGLQPGWEALLQYCATPGNDPETGKPYYSNTNSKNDFKYAFNAASPGETEAEIRLK